MPCCKLASRTMRYILQIIFLTWACIHHAQVTFNGLEQYSLPDTNQTGFTLSFTIEEGFYIQSDQPLDDNLIPAQLEIAFDSSESHSIKFSQPVLKKGWSEGQVISVFDRHFSIDLQLLQPDISYRRSLQGTLVYQACDQKKCYFPKELQFEIELTLKKD